MRERARGKEFVETKRVYEIPCEHPAAVDGVVYMEADFEAAPHMHDDYEFFLVDSKILEDLDQNMKEHAEKRFSSTSVASWLRQGTDDSPNSPKNTIAGGTWSYHADRGVTFNTGQAEILQLIKETKLPYFPIAVGKNDGVEEIKRRFAYKPKP